MANKYYVSHHAVERLRQRLTGSKLVMKTDAELRKLINEAIQHGTVEQAFDPVVKEDFSICKMPQFTDHLGGVAVAVLRKNNRKGAAPVAVATIMPESYADKKFAVGEWKRKNGVPMNGIKGLENVRLADEDPKPDPVPDADADKPLTVLLTWLYTDSTRRAGLVEYGYDAVTTPIKVMLDNPDIVSDSIRVWREIPLSIKREVKVEIGS